jgi:hypothetical protein
MYENIEVSRFCICADQEGHEWIKKNTPPEKLAKLCFHDPDKDALRSLRLVFSERNQYAEFGKERFIKLTTFKWQLIRDSILAHPDSLTHLFSDLDVIWFTNPFYYEQISSFSGILAQDDTPKASTSIHLCSGIMFFPNENRSLQILNSLFQRQLTSNISGFLIPDEPILNQWYKEAKPLQPKLAVLDSKQFIIGHRFLYSLFWRTSQRDKMVCFHVNYVVGEKRKARRAKAVLCRKQGDLRWIPYFAMELTSIIFSKLLRR